MSEARRYAMPDPEAVAARIKAEGGPAIDPSEATGKASADGVTIGWSIAGGEIVVTIVSKPWIVPYTTIWSHVESVLS